MRAHASMSDALRSPTTSCALDRRWIVRICSCPSRRPWHRSNTRRLFRGSCGSACDMAGLNSGRSQVRSMSEHLLLAPLLESYFRRRLTKQRNATPATVASYRDALRMLILFAAARLRKKPAALALEELDRDLVLAFLDELEEKRSRSRA